LVSNTAEYLIVLNAGQTLRNFITSPCMNKILFFNPRSAKYKPRIPNSILSVAGAVEGLYEYVIVDGNLETDPAEKIF